MDSFLSDLKKQFIGPFPGERAQLSMSPEIRDYMNNLKKKTLVKKAGVAIIIFQKEGVLYTVFIKRPKYDGPHSAQISFPGGKLDYVDNNLIQTAIRETQEEVGIKADDLLFISSLSPLYIPISNILVQPVVFFLPYQPVYCISTREVDHVIEIDFKTLFDDNSVKEKTLQIGEINFNTPYYDVYDNHIWGATAMVVAELKEIMKGFNLDRPNFYSVRNDR